jgi:ABC-2 type transport system ATP-binding protein
VRQGSIEELRAGAEGAGTVLVRSPAATRLAEVLRAAGLQVLADGGDRLTVERTTPAAVGQQAFGAGVELHELRARSSGLEEIYFQLTAGQEQFAAAPPGSGSWAPAPSEGAR